MRRSHLGQVLVATLLGLAADSAFAANLAAEEAAIRDLFERHRKGIEARSLAAVSQTFDHAGPLVVWTGSDRTPITDWPTLERLYRDWFANSQEIQMTDTCIQIRVHPSGLAAWASYFTDETVTSAGKRNTEHLRATFGLEKHGQNWVVVQAHWSMPHAKRRRRNLAIRTRS